MSSSGCPSQDDLHGWVQGALPADKAAALGAHLVQCRECEQTVHRLEATKDSLLHWLKGASAASLTSPIENNRFEKWSENLQEGEGGRLGELAPVNRIRDYVLVEKLGQGGMGVVYRAVHGHLEKQVAIKLLPPYALLHDGAVQRFKREMKAIGRLDHPNLVRAFDAGQEGSLHYLVMELLEGEDLAAVVRDRGSLAVHDACELVRQAALGLQYAHEHGLVHRDIKPSNLMLTRDGTTKILDLGLSRITDLADEASRPVTGHGQVMGTLEYMAPEQSQESHDVDIRADIYSLGATLYKFLTGRAPFDGPRYSSLASRLSALEKEEPPRIDRVRPDIPPQLVGIVHRMLAKSPSARFATPGEVGRALAPFTAGANLARLLTKDAGGSAASPDGARDEPPSRAVGQPVKTRPRPVSRRALMWSLLLLAALATVVTVIATDRGTIRIESDDPNIPINITRNGELVDHFVISQRPNSIKLRTGYYTIEVAGKFQGIEVHDGEFTLSRGGVRVVRISKREANVAGGSALATTPKTPVSPVAAQKPFVVKTGGGELLGEYTQFSEVIPLLQDETVVEIHGHGPFQVPAFQFRGSRLTLRGAKGFRPTLAAVGTIPEWEAWIHVAQADVELENCDLRGGWATVLDGKGARWRIHNCRFLGGMLAIHFAGESLSVSDSLLAAQHGIRLGADTQLSMHNTAACVQDGVIGVPATGRQVVRIRECTLISAGACVQPDGPLGSQSLDVECVQSIVQADTMVARESPENLASWFRNGSDNVFCRVGHLPSRLPAEAGFEDVADLWFAWDRLRVGPTDEGIAAMRLALEKARIEYGLPELGPNIDLLGVGDAYLRALAAEGRPAAAELRPPPPPEGAFVVMRGGELQQGYLTLQDAVVAAKDGDVVEIRSDGPFQGAQLAGTERRIFTIRAAPGYRPVLTGGLSLREPSTVSVEGILFRGGLLTDETYAGEARLVNCAFEAGATVAFAIKHPELVEFVNCWLPVTLTIDMPPGAPPLRFRNCVLGGLVPHGHGGDQARRAMELDHCVLWRAGLGEPALMSSRGFAIVANMKGELAIHAKATWFQATHGVALLGTGPWKGEGNLYACPSECTPVVEAFGMLSADSRRGDPAVFDPTQWQLAPNQPAWRDEPSRRLGVDTSRLGIVP